MTAAVTSKTRSYKARPNAAQVVGAVADALILMAVLVFSALAIVVIALGAPLILGISAMTGAFAPKRAHGRWREAHAA